MTDTAAEVVARKRREEPEFRRRRLSLIWALPVVAGLVAAWLGWVAISEKGPEITVTFKTAAGLEAGKTRIKHHDVELGVVDRVEPSPDLSHVVVHARMSKMAAEHLREGAKFWVVRPRLSLTSLSGLETLVSGAYIEMDPGAGKSLRTFGGLEDPPIVRADVPGTEFVLETEKIGSIGPGSPVYYRGIGVGEVTRYEFTGVEKKLPVHLFIRKPYDALVNARTRFWSASGIGITAGPSGFKVEIDSLQAVLAGGVAFENPEGVALDRPAAEAMPFALFENRQAARESAYTKRNRLIVEFGGSVRGLEPGAPVEFRGIKVGRVVEFRLAVDADRQTARIPVLIEGDLERFGVVNLPPEELGSGKLLTQLVARGLRAQLRTSSLITGQLFIALDFFPDAPPAQMTEENGLPRLPTVENDLENVTRSVNEVLDKVVSLPIGELMQDVRKLVASTQAIVASPDVAEALRSFNSTMSSTDRLMSDIGTQAGPLIASLRRVGDSTDATVRRADTLLASMNSSYGRDSQVRGEMQDLLKQLQETAKSVKYLASYLEQHPEALVRGKAGNP